MANPAIEEMIATYLLFALKHFIFFFSFPHLEKNPLFCIIMFIATHYTFVGEEYVFPFCFPKIIKRDYEIRNAFSADN